MFTQRQYIEYLLSTPFNYTCTHLAEHVADVSHDQVNRFLRQRVLPPRQLREVVAPLLAEAQGGFLLVDDSVQDKSYSRFIELVKRQYSGNVGGLVRGIGLVNLVYSSGQAGDFLPIDYRIYAPQDDGKTKNDHFREMFAAVVAAELVPARTVLFDTWYASAENLKTIHRAGWTFFTTLKSNRLVSRTKETGYEHLDQLPAPPGGWEAGQWVRLQQVPFAVRLFKLVAPHGDIDWVITNQPDPTLTAEVVAQTQATRWQVEEFHRSFKQLTGAEKCQCRRARAQRNHLACCYLAWIALREKARQLGQTLYQLRQHLFAHYLIQELRNPRIPALLPTGA